MRRRVILAFLLGTACALLVAGIPVATRRPSNARNWLPEQARIPHIRLWGDSVRIEQVRDFRWRADSSVVPAWANRAYDLGRMRRVYFVLSPFARAWRGPAHTFLAFEFDDGTFVDVSVEARKEVGEEYSPLRRALISCLRPSSCLRAS